MKTLLIIIFITTAITSCRNACQKDVICLNEGICRLNSQKAGTCICPPRFSGPSCETENQHSKVTIKRVRLTRFPTTNNGLPWDPVDSSGPDIEIRIKPYPYLISWIPIAHNAGPEVEEFYPLNPWMQLPDSIAEYWIVAYEYDYFPKQLRPMDSINFLVHNPGGDSLATIFVDNGGTMAGEVDLHFKY